MYVAVDASGETRADTDSFTFKLPAQTKARSQADGHPLPETAEPSAGRYHLRVGAHDTATGAVGTVSYDLDVPDFNKLPLGDERPPRHIDGGGVLDGQGERDAELQKFMNAPPVSLRTFRKS